MELILSICVGVSLAAACGFRVFVPLLVMSVAAQSGHMTLAHDFAWIATPVATVAFLIATALEVAGFYVPYIDHLLDTIAAPAAVVAGTVVTAACITDMDPFLRWSLAVIAGGGAAGVVQGVTSVTRFVSTATTGGFGNPLVSTAEAGGATFMAALAVFVPVLGAILAVALVIWASKTILAAYRRRAAKRAAGLNHTPPPPPPSRPTAPHPQDYSI